MRSAELPPAVWWALGVDPAVVTRLEVATFRDGTGAASGRVDLITMRWADERPRRLVRKTFRPLRSGPHANDAQSPDHWAHWGRELMAYASGLLPTGPGLRAPDLVAIVDDTVYVEYVGEQQPEPEATATALGSWHLHDHTDLTLPWLAHDQLAQRVAVTDLDWTAVDVDPRLRVLWDRRHDYLARLDSIPRCVTHGDFSPGNLRSVDDSLVALDWATLGCSPVGFDLGHLALAGLDESLFAIYLEALRGRYDAEDVRLGYRTTVSLVGASRVHWMATRSIPLPDGYADFVAAHKP